MSKRATPPSRKTPQVVASAGKLMAAKDSKRTHSVREGGLAIHCTSKALPSKSGMAFVMIHHLTAEHESALPPIVDGDQHCPAVEASDGLAGEPNHFSIALPEERGNAVIGVVHSGTGRWTVRTACNSYLQRTTFAVLLTRS